MAILFFSDLEGVKSSMEPMRLIEKMDCDYVPAIYTGDKAADDKANAALYLKLVEEGENKGFCPVLVDRQIDYYFFPYKYGFTESKSDYPRITKKLIELSEENCFSVWLGRLIYNYYLDGLEFEDGVKESLEDLIPPTTMEYLSFFDEKPKIKEFVLGEEDDFFKPYDFSYEEHVFVFVPVCEPWKVLAWIPMGGFNWCPDAVHQVALAKGLYERFGARIMYIDFSTLEYYIPEPLIRKEDVEEAAKILIAADDDIYQDYSVAVNRIRGRHIWSMWWD